MSLVKPKWLEGDEKSPSLVISQKQEKRLAKQYGGRTTAGSGNKRTKGDVQAYYKSGVTPKLIEAKITDKDSMKVQREWLEKISKEAFQQGSEPVFVFGFTRAEFGAKEWAAVPAERLKELFDIEKEHKSHGKL